MGCQRSGHRHPDRGAKSSNGNPHALEGNKHGRVVVEHGTARFEVAGALPSKLVCHRNPDADSDFSWAVRTRFQ